MCWSGGKDSAMALHSLLSNEMYDVIGLFTTVNKDYNRISMHGVRKELLEMQAESIGFPLEIMEMGSEADNSEYENSMEEIMLRYKARGIDRVAFGDLHLEDVRIYRENNLSRIDMEAIFPLWGENTRSLSDSFVNEGFKAIVTCVDTTMLNEDFSGRTLDRSFFNDLPNTVDPCGENGEYHSFVYSGPIFKNEVKVKRGDLVLRDDRFQYCDLLSQ